MKVPEPRKLQSGTWFIQLRLGGVSVPVSATTKKECIRQAQLIKAEHQVGKRKTNIKTDKTLKELMQDYIDALPASTSPSTIRGYNTIKNTRFLSVDGISVSAIKDWQKVIDEESKCVGAKTVKNAWSLARSSMRASGIDIQDVKMPQIIKKEKQWLEPDEILRFVKLLKNTTYEIPVLLALHGLRRSEILAMTYEKIDINANTITVHGSAVMDKDGTLVQKVTNKNVSSRRVIPIMIPELTEAIKAIPEDKRTGNVFNGNVNTLYGFINRICESNNLPLVGVHGLRHSFASLAFHLGLTEQETMELGGWSDYNTMRNIYTHLAQADRLKGHNKIANFFAGETVENNKNANGNAN